MPHIFPPQFFKSVLFAITFFLEIYASGSDTISGQKLLGSSFGIPGPNVTYDYVIVGGGNAGLVLANRLSESGAHTVAVIEAGSFYEISNGNHSQVPRYMWDGGSTTFEDVNPLVDWNFKTEPEEGIGGKQIHYPRGKTLGGSTARNNMIYQRGTKGSYKKWAEGVGDKSYKWESFSRWFDKSTTFHPADMSKRWSNSTPMHDPAGSRATSGPVDISYGNWVLPFTSWAFRAVQALGMRQIPGWLDGDLIGSSWDVRTVNPDTQIRASAETAFLRPALKRPNLIVHHSTMAVKILFSGTEAVGVWCNTLGKEYILSAKKEVILSAGAIQSPQLLMVSGIGPRKILSSFNIPIIKDAPGVGMGLEDHPAVGITFKIRAVSSTALDTLAKHEAATLEFLESGSGPLTSTGMDILAWEKLPRRLLPNSTSKDLGKSPTDWPDLEYIVSSIYPGQPPDKDDYAGLTAILVNTFSRGSISIPSGSMFDQPIIHVGLLGDYRDREIAIAAVRRMREILAQPSLDQILVGGESVPGDGLNTDEEIWKYIQSSSRTISHASCTCRMGKINDPMAVVNSKGQVFGVGKLRVVDLSAIPFLPPGHPMATVYALAEKLSDDILNGGLPRPILLDQSLKYRI
ncbi:alcohol oxidase [Corynespora cassiicola Philippines]|uniref:Alcohol oxidase n=1 Tax=Corynespora cassiicola Philippines TaxID=1448308 RepID=A0A2T2N6W2_CORCC|nr:alcohol oxidase [Corynespora cassiicola Philippines]